jgi:hypothetical protein
VEGGWLLNDLKGVALEAQLSSLPEPETTVPPKRSLEDMVAEIMDTSRAAAKTGQELQGQVANVQRVLVRAPFGDYMMSLFTPTQLERNNVGVAGPTGLLKEMADLNPNPNTKAKKDQENQKRRISATFK